MIFYNIAIGIYINMHRGIARKIRNSVWTSVTEDYLFILYIFNLVILLL